MTHSRRATAVAWFAVTVLALAGAVLTVLASGPLRTSETISNFAAAPPRSRRWERCCPRGQRDRLVRARRRGRTAIRRPPDYAVWAHPSGTCRRRSWWPAGRVELRAGFAALISCCCCSVGTLPSPRWRRRCAGARPPRWRWPGSWCTEADRAAGAGGESRWWRTRSASSHGATCQPSDRDPNSGGGDHHAAGGGHRTWPRYGRADARCASRSSGSGGGGGVTVASGGAAGHAATGTAANPVTTVAAVVPRRAAGDRAHTVAIRSTAVPDRRHTTAHRYGRCRPRYGHYVHRGGDGTTAGTRAARAQRRGGAATRCCQPRGAGPAAGEPDRVGQRATPTRCTDRADRRASWT